MYWNIDEKKDSFDVILDAYLDKNSMSAFPWIIAVPLKDKAYVVNMYVDDFCEERDSYIITTVIIDENQITGESTEHIFKEECHETDLETYISGMLDSLKENKLYPTSSNEFELEIYDWVKNNSENKISNEVFEFIINKCKEAEAIYSDEYTREQYIEKLVAETNDNE